MHAYRKMNKASLCEAITVHAIDILKNNEKMTKKDLGEYQILIQIEKYKKQESVYLTTIE